MKLSCPSLGSALLALVVAACGSVGVPPRSGADSAYFVGHVKPVLQRNCLSCHNDTARTGGISLSNAASAVASRREGGPLIVPGDPDRSLLVAAVSRQGAHPLLMPRRELSLTDVEIGVLREWIEDGAHWPAGAKGRLRASPNPEYP